MKCALAAVGFINEDSIHNKNVIIEIMKQYATRADMVIFGEAFLQGFYGLNFQVEHDENIAVSKDDDIIREICDVAKEYKIGVSFGFIEKKGKYSIAVKLRLTLTEQFLIFIVGYLRDGRKNSPMNSIVKEMDSIRLYMRGNPLR